MASRDLFNHNRAPEQGRISRRNTIILWLVAVSSAFLLISLYLVYTTIRGDVARLEANIQTVQETLASSNTPGSESKRLMDELSQAQESVNQIEEAYSTIVAGHTDWSAVMTAIGSYNPTQITLNSLTQADNQIILNGHAIDDSVVVAYSRALEGTGLFSRVVVQSIKIVATPSATPTSTEAETPDPTPTVIITPTVTPPPTPAARDEYEVDDFQPQAIFMGQPQLHNFHPIYDVDRVKFLAKAGRYYRVSTSDLAPGVDTFLTVNLGESTSTNDDHGPGELRSEIMFQGEAGRDLEAVITVTNRGQYGPDKSYTISVEELIPTPTPTETPPSSSRLPGAASCISLAVVDPPLSLPMMAERATILQPLSSGQGGMALSALNSEAVEFVIVLELSRESP